MLDIVADSEVPSGFTGRVRKSTDGVVAYVAWFNKGRMDDPDGRTPAYIRYRRNGDVKQERHYRLGRLHDPAPDLPAVRGYYADGSVHYEERFRYGRRHDVDGAAAILKWRNDGTLRSELHYHEGVRINGMRPALRR